MHEEYEDYLKDFINQLSKDRTRFLDMMLSRAGYLTNDSQIEQPVEIPRKRNWNEIKEEMRRKNISSEEMRKQFVKEIEESVDALNAT